VHATLALSAPSESPASPVVAIEQPAPAPTSKPASRRARTAPARTTDQEATPAA